MDKAAFDAHASGRSIAIVREEAKGWATTTIVGRGDTLYPPDGGAYWHM